MSLYPHCLSPASPLTSMIMCMDHPGLTFNLSLVRSQHTYNQPMQQWTFISDFAVSIYFPLHLHLPLPQAYISTTDLIINYEHNNAIYLLSFTYSGNVQQSEQVGVDQEFKIDNNVLFLFLK